MMMMMVVVVVDDDDDDDDDEINKSINKSLTMNYSILSKLSVIIH